MVLVVYSSQRKRLTKHFTGQAGECGVRRISRKIRKYAYMADTNETTSLRIVRRFDVPPGVVFSAFTKLESMKVWWDENTSFDINLVVGGRWTIIRKEGEATYTATGEYLEIEQPHRLKYTYAMPQFSPNSDTISIEIVSTDTGCIVTFVQSGKDIANELREITPGSISDSEAGWQQGFDLMAAAWEKPA